MKVRGFREFVVLDPTNRKPRDAERPEGPRPAETAVSRGWAEAPASFPPPEPPPPAPENPIQAGLTLMPQKDDHPMTAASGG